MKKYKPVVLIVLDGWGYRPEEKDNAIALANTPYFDHLWQDYPHTLLEASGEAVGMPAGQIGNSEVCHLTIGAGRAIDTDLVRINKAIENGSFESNQVFKDLFSHLKKYNSWLHVFGLVSPGGVHSHQSHLFAFLRAAKKAGINKIAIHAITDGRDVLPQSADRYLTELEIELEKLGVGKIATVCGRYYAMDRDQNWDRTEVYEKLLFDGEGEKINPPAGTYLKNLHQEGKLPLDELMNPVVINHDTDFLSIKDNDGVFCFNFRSDRARQIISRLSVRSPKMNLFLATMTKYDRQDNIQAAFPPLKIETTLAQEISNANLTQAHIAETEKFAHATYFLNGGRQEAYLGEKQILIESRKDVKTHDEAPEMKAAEIAQAAVEELSAGTEFIFINFANADMVGHTGNNEATIRAIEFLDQQLKTVVEKTLALGGAAIISADHGNAEQTKDDSTGSRHTAHTTNPVPVIITATDFNLAKNRTIAGLAPTALRLLGVTVPKGMENDLFED